MRADLLAGVTVTAYLVPQVMAYAELAGLPPYTGLWAAMGALAAYAALGTSRRLSVGPESTTALMTAAALGSVAGETDDPLTAATTLAVVVAAICVVGWLARISVLAELLSRPVLVGYMAGIAVIMVVSQAGTLLGVRLDADDVAPRLVELAGRLDEVHAPTAALALTTLGLMLAAAARWPRAPVTLVGMLGATAAALLLDLGAEGVAVVGGIPSALPPVSTPGIDLALVPVLLAPALGVAFVGYTDNVLTARAFADRHGERIDARRELLALGAANLGAGVMHGFPVSSSGSRTAIADAVGARTRLAGVTTLLVTVVALLTARPLLGLFPTAALAAVVVYAATRIVDVAELRRFGRFRRSELVLALATSVAVLALGVLVGVVAAIALSVLDLLRRVARPHDAVEGAVPGVAGFHDIDDYPEARQDPGLLIYRYDSPLFFANVEDFRHRARAAVEEAERTVGPVEWFVLNTEAMVEVDITAVDALESLRSELAARGIVLALARVKQDLRDALAPTGLLDRVGEEHVFLTLRTAIEAHRRFRGEQA
ncbi:SulP family inorganic anion transporter [Nocardioides sp. GCM10027113]|uniref:SulP family inorganic anion transporter n=1 Tax=unclassified Nocardioides TaxID=2615069 RepID=UPI003605DC3B